MSTMYYEQLPISFHEDPVAMAIRKYQQAGKLPETYDEPIDFGNDSIKLWAFNLKNITSQLFDEMSKNKFNTIDEILKWIKSKDAKAYNGTNWKELLDIIRKIPPKKNIPGTPITMDKENKLNLYLPNPNNLNPNYLPNPDTNGAPLWPDTKNQNPNRRNPGQTGYKVPVNSNNNYPNLSTPYPNSLNNNYPINNNSTQKSNPILDGTWRNQNKNTNNNTPINYKRYGGWF